MKKIFSLMIMLLTIFLTTGCNFSSSVYRQFNKQFDQFKSKIETTNQVIINMDINIEMYEKSVYLGKDSIAATIKMNQSPLYIDVTMGSRYFEETYILSQKGNDLYEHEVINDNVVITDYYSSVDEYENSEYDSIFDFNYNSKYGKVKKEENFYIFSLTIDDTLTDDDKEYLDDLYDILGLSLDDVLESKLDIKFKFDGDKLFISYDMNSDMKVKDRNIQVKSYLEYDIRIESFNLIDLDNCEHLSRTIDSVYNYSKIDQVYNYCDTNVRYYKYKLDKGYYYIDRFSDLNDFQFSLYDSNKQKLSINYLFNHSNNKSKYGTMFEVKEDGDYYIKIENCKDTFALKKLNINDYKEYEFKENEANELDLKENQFSYIDLSFSKEFICLENSGNTKIKIENLYDNSTYIINSNEKYYIATKKIKNGLILTNLGSNETCNLTVKEVDKSGSLETPYEELEVITNTPSEGFYYCDDYNNAIIKLIVEEQGYYTFYNTKDGISSKMYFEAKKISGEYYRWMIDNTYLLLPGEYLITMSNSSNPAYGNVYYEFEATNIQFNYEITVDKGKNPEINTFPTVHLMDNHGLEYVKYYFNIEEEYVLYENGQNIYLHYENGDYVGGVNGYFHLKPGRYYMDSILDFQEDGYEFKFGIIEFDNRDFNFNLSKTNSNNLDTVRYLDNEHFPVCGYFRYWFTLEEDSKIIHDYDSCKIYDENGNMISTDKKIIELSSGRYYVTLHSNIYKMYLYTGE